MSKGSFQKFVKSLHQNIPASKEGAAVLPTSISETILALNSRAVQSLASSAMYGVPFMQTLEEAQIPGISPRYALVHDELGPAGFAMFSVISLESAQPRVGKGASQRRGASRSRSETTSWPGGGSRVLCGGHPLLWGSSYFGFRDREPAPSVIASLIRAGYRIRKWENSPVSVLKGFEDSRRNIQERIESFGYVRFPSLPDWALPVDPSWRNFNDFLQSLPARNRREIQGHMLAFEKTGLTIEPARPSPIAGELCELHTETAQRAVKPWIGATPAFFRAAEQHIRGGFRLFIVRKGDRIVAFVCSVVDQDPGGNLKRLVALLFGAREEFEKKYHLSANLTYKLVEEAISGDFDELDLGPRAVVTKELGAVLQPRFCLVRHRNPGADRLTRLIFDQLIVPEARKTVKR